MRGFALNITFKNEVQPMVAYLLYILRLLLIFYHPKDETVTVNRRVNNPLKYRLQYLTILSIGHPLIYFA